MMTRTIGWEKMCSVCGEEFVNIGHPLKPGVIMMRDCACVRETKTVEGVTIITARVPTLEERAKWRIGHGKSREM
jgi:hypothetical protein